MLRIFSEFVFVFCRVSPLLFAYSPLVLYGVDDQSFSSGIRRWVCSVLCAVATGERDVCRVECLTVADS